MDGEERVLNECRRQALALSRTMALSTPLVAGLMVLATRPEPVRAAAWVAALVVCVVGSRLAGRHAQDSERGLERWAGWYPWYLGVIMAVWVASLPLFRPSPAEPELQSVQIIVLVAVAMGATQMGAFLVRLGQVVIAMVFAGAAVYLVSFGLGINRVVGLLLPVGAVILLQLLGRMHDSTVRAIVLAHRNEELLEELDRDRRRLSHEATHDALTGLLNRAAFLDRTERALAALDPRTPVALAYLDLDGFKAVNDAHGHGVGDELLELAARRLGRATRDDDVVARMGGDEFTVYLGAVDDPDAACAAVERVVAAFEATFVLDGRPLRVGASAGVALCEGRIGVDDLIQAADRALYEAKQAGGHCVVMRRGPCATGGQRQAS